MAPVRKYLEDPDISEIMINGHDNIYVESKGKLTQVTNPDELFPSEQALESAMRNVVQFTGKRLIPENPSIEARLPDGSRVHVVQAPAAGEKLCATIRKFFENRIGMGELVEKKSMTQEAREFLELCVLIKKNVIVSGGTGSGKTTLLNCLSSVIQKDERIIVLEDSTELELQQDHVLSFEVQPGDRNGRGAISIRDLFRASLRMRPDRIIVGECRGGEALDMIQAMTSGHSGSLSTCHANTPRDALGRLEVMALMSGVDLPLFALRAQVASAVDVVVQISRMHSGDRKITCISEVMPLEDDLKYRVRDIYKLGKFSTNLDAALPDLEWTGNSVTFGEELSYSGLTEQVALTGKVWEQ